MDRAASVALNVLRLVDELQERAIENDKHRIERVPSDPGE